METLRPKACSFIGCPPLLISLQYCLPPLIPPPPPQKIHAYIYTMIAPLDYTHRFHLVLTHTEEGNPCIHTCTIHQRWTVTSFRILSLLGKTCPQRWRERLPKAPEYPVQLNCGLIVSCSPAMARLAQNTGPLPPTKETKYTATKIVLTNEITQAIKHR